MYEAKSIEVGPGMLRRLAARFALLAFGLFHLPLLLNNYPTLGGGGSRDDGLSLAWGRVFGHVGLWVARNVFGMTGRMPYALSGDNGDTAEEYCRLLVGVVIAALAAGIWTALDRRRPGARWVEQALWVLLRYAIALGLASYAIAKIFPQQFGWLSPTSLEMRVGELSPMRLLWRFMEYSKGYSTVAGWAELTVVVLLCFRRTALLGALLCLPVMSTVMLMNLCYGVMVKLYSIMMVASALVLVLYDARRLFDDRLLRCERAGDDAAHTLELTCDDKQSGSLRWTRDGDRLRLEGSFGGAEVTASLKRRDVSEIPLLRERFHWVWDG